jgi:hypothetical protein
LVAGRINYIDGPPSSPIAAQPATKERSIGSQHDPRPDTRPVRLDAMDLEASLADPALKQRFVTPMFDIIAPRYDRFTRVFSFGMDRL